MPLKQEVDHRSSSDKEGDRGCFKVEKQLEYSINKVNCLCRSLVLTKKLDMLDNTGMEQGVEASDAGMTAAEE